MGLLKRDIDDVNSNFYKIKDTALEYILSLMEGEGFYPLEDDVPDRNNKFLVSNLMCSNITPRTLFELMTSMVKKLMMYRLMQKDKSFRGSILKKVRRKREEEQKKQLATAQLSLQIVENMNKKFEADDKLFTDYEDRDSIITKEMMDVWKCDDYEDILELYKTD